MSSSIQLFKADLHVHTVLSPCAEVEMIPPLIVDVALDLGIQIIAITDHNSSANIRSVQKAAEGKSLTVIPGMEIQTREDVHSLCLFDTIDQISAFQQIVNNTLPHIPNEPDHFGEQFIVDESGEFITRETQLLLTSSSLSINEAWKIVNEMGGLFIPAHVDRKAFGMIENLGFIPIDLPIQAVEISKFLSPSNAITKYPQLNGYRLLQNGDVHRLEEFNGSMCLQITEPTITEIKLAIQQSNGRDITFLLDN